MKKTNKIINESAVYQPPQIRIIRFKSEGVLCQSLNLGGDGGSDPDNETPGYGGDLDWGL